jgi:hypothetical protein
MLLQDVRVDAVERVIANANEIFEALITGEKKRAVSSTAMNNRSSRSHAIFRITVESRPIEEETTGMPDHRASTADFGSVVSGTLNLIDLAGSESVRRTNAQGDRLREAGNINTSLVTLSRCIAIIADQGNATTAAAKEKLKVPFRDSKLTWVLKNALEGNTRIAIICCLTPDERYLGESRSTLQFAQQAKRLRLTCKVNEVEDEDTSLKNLTREMSRIKAELEMYKAREAEFRSTIDTSAPTTVASSAPTAAATAQAAASAAADNIKIVEMEKMIEKYREQIFVGGTMSAAPKAAKIDNAAFDELVRLRQRVETTVRQAALGRSKRHRETWCPTASSSTGFSADFLSSLKAGPRLPKPPTSAPPSDALNTTASAAGAGADSIAEDEMEGEDQSEGEDDSQGSATDVDDGDNSGNDDDVISFKPRTKIRRSSEARDVHDMMPVQEEEADAAPFDEATQVASPIQDQPEVTELRQALESKDAEANDLRSQLNQVQDQLDRCRDALAEYEQMVTLSLGREEALENESQALKEQGEANSQEILQLTHHRDSLAQQVEVFEAKLCAVEAQMKAATMQHNDSNAVFESAIAQQTEKILSQQSELTQQAAAFEQERVAFVATNKAAEDRTNALIAEKSAIVEQLSASQQAVQHTEIELQQRDQQIVSLQAHVAELIQQQQKSTAAESALRQDLTTSAEKIAAMKSELSDRTKEIQDQRRRHQEAGS